MARKPPYTAAAERGAALLDEHRPGWHERTDLDDLDMASLTACVLAQEYDREWRSYPYSDGLDDLGCPSPIRHGFDLPTLPLGTSAEVREARYARLTEAWRTLITERRAATT